MLLDQPQLTPPGWRPHLRHAMFGFPSPAMPAPSGLRVFAAGGYSVIRHCVAGRSLMAVIDHGELGYLSIAAHGHADTLAVWLHVDGQPVIVDAGTYLYHAGGDWRCHFRSTAAHNTLRLEQVDASDQAGNFNWSHKARARLIASHAGHQPASSKPNTMATAIASAQHIGDGSRCRSRTPNYRSVTVSPRRNHGVPSQFPALSGIAMQSRG